MATPLEDPSFGEAIEQVAYGLELAIFGEVLEGDDEEGFEGDERAAINSLRLTGPAMQPSTLDTFAVFRPALNQRNGVFWVSARQWFAPAKLAGVATMKRAKDSMNPEMLGAIGADLAEIARSIFGATGGFVTAPPARHSAYAGRPHFASRLAEDLAEALELEYRPIFEPTPANRLGHHPAREKDPPKLIAEALEYGERVLLIDDIATSGATLELSAKAIRAAGGRVSAIVGIYGATNGLGRQG